MSKEALTFTRENGKYVSNVFTIHGNAAVHIEKVFEGPVTIEQRTGLDTGDEDDTSVMFDVTYSIPTFAGCREADIVGYVFPKQVRISCPIQNASKFKPSDSVSDDVRGYYVGE